MSSFHLITNSAGPGSVVDDTANKPYTLIAVHNDIANDRFSASSVGHINQMPLQPPKIFRSGEFAESLQQQSVLLALIICVNSENGANRAKQTNVLSILP